MEYVRQPRPSGRGFSITATSPNKEPCDEISWRSFCSLFVRAAGPQRDDIALFADDKEKKDDVKTLTYGHIELHGSYPEGAGAPGLFGDILETLTAGLKRLDKAAKDDDLAGVVLHINGPQLGWAKLHEFRQADSTGSAPAAKPSPPGWKAARRRIISSPPRATKSCCRNRAC